MPVERFRRSGLPPVAAHNDAPRATVARDGGKLRLLQRRVAAARLGVSGTGSAALPSPCEDLR
jgi:hypothetical protein